MSPQVPGIPPHIKHLCRIDEGRQITLGIREDISHFCQHLCDSVSEAIVKKVCADGGFNSIILEERLKNIKALLLQRMKTCVQTLVLWQWQLMMEMS